MYPLFYGNNCVHFFVETHACSHFQKICLFFCENFVCTSMTLLCISRSSFVMQALETFMLRMHKWTPIHEQKPSTYGSVILIYFLCCSSNWHGSNKRICGLRVSYTTTVQPASGPDGVYALALQTLMEYSKRCYSLD